MRNRIDRQVRSHLCGLLLVVGFSSPSWGANADDPNRAVRFEQHLNRQISTDTILIDETGKQVRLADLMNRPTILTMGYHRCPMLCGVVLDSVTKVFAELHDLVPGNDYQFIFIGIDPNETPALAAAKKETYLRRLHSPEAAQGWHFLLGSSADIRKIADEIGFEFRYDKLSQQFVHPTGLVFVTPAGRVSSYLMGVNYSINQLKSNLRLAGQQKIGSSVDDLLLLCLHYNPKTGYGPVIFTSLRIGALFTVLLVGWLVLRGVNRREPSP